MLKKFFSGSASLPLLVGLVALVGSLALLSWGGIPGYPDSVQKNVGIFPSTAGAQDVSVTLQAPMGTHQFQGESQTLAVQVANRRKETIDLQALHVEPAACFSISPDEPGVQPVRPGASIVVLKQLLFLGGGDRHAPPDCLGEHPLTLIYTWTYLPDPVAPAPVTSAGPTGRRRSDSPRRGAVQPRLSKSENLVSVQQAITTTPITLTTHGIHDAERFVRAGKVVLLPTFLALLTLLFQTLQAGRDRKQNRENLRIEVWKVIFPTIVERTEKHYIPIVRRMAFALGSIDLQRDHSTILLSLLIVRKRIKHLLDHGGGYYFESKPGEELVGKLNNLFNSYWQRRTGLAFGLLVENLTLQDTVQSGLQTLQSRGELECFHRALPLLGRLPDQDDSTSEPLEYTRHLLALFSAVLEFECDRPLYPKWYKQPPRISMDLLQSTHLFLTGEDTVEMEALLRDYRDSIPLRCRK